MELKKRKNKFTKNDKILIEISKIYLFPLYLVGIFLRAYDLLKLKLENIVNYKILKKKNKNKIEDWWI